jgi:hypothetical protein
MVVAGDGRRLGLGAALGPGGDGVSDLLDAVVAEPRADGPAAAVLAALAQATPAGDVALPVDEVGLRAAVAAADRVDPGWLARVDARREAARRAVVAAGRADALEAALHVAMLVATERFDPPEAGDEDALVASGARLWLLTAAVASALAAGDGAGPDPFAGWGRLVAAGWWPVGPCDGRLVVSGVAGADRGRRPGRDRRVGCAGR